MALSHTDTPKRRRITGKSLPASPAPAGSDPWKDPNDIEVVFKDYHGAARIERIFEVFGDPKGESMDIGWFTEGQPNVVSDPVNRPLQQATVLEYEARIFESGLADDCSGILPGYGYPVSVFLVVFLFCRLRVVFNQPAQQQTVQASSSNQKCACATVQANATVCYLNAEWFTCF